MVKIDTSTEPRIVKYQDREDVFVFANFWKDRDYDHKAEILLIENYLRRYFKDQPDNAWLVDIGGSFGRLLSTYAPYFKEVAILDYAVSEFYMARDIARKEKIDLHLVAANAYHLPLAANSQSALIAIRLIHHLEDPLWFFEEVERVLKPGGTFVCQAANKNHLKTLLLALVKFDFSIWRLNWLDIGAKGMQEDGSFALIRNYSPAYLEGLIKKSNLKIVRRRSTSWLRNVKFLQALPGSVNILERFLQALSPLMPLGPSNWYLLKKASDLETGGDVSESSAKNFISSLCDPQSQKRLPKEGHPKHTKKTNKNVVYLDLRHPKN